MRYVKKRGNQFREEMTTFTVFKGDDNKSYYPHFSSVFRGMPHFFLDFVGHKMIFAPFLSIRDLKDSQITFAYAYRHEITQRLH
jgi:hypothetical protein